jgi:hypothetical protein
VSAADEPDTPAKRMLPPTFTSPNPPRAHPIREFAKSMIRWDIPPPVRSSPTKMKKGIANRLKESMPATDLLKSAVSGMSSQSIATSVDTPIA